MIVVLDLDDTLYLERDYVCSGIAAVGERVATDLGVEGFAASAQRLWDAGVRLKLFDTTLERLGVEPTQNLVEELVAHYRAHRPTIALAPDAADFLAGPHGHALALITDGHHLSQRRKVEALALEQFGIDPVVYTDQWGHGFCKPHPRAFKLVEAHHRRTDEPIVYIADNPVKDFLAPRALGWRTIQIDRPGAVHSRIAPSGAHRADATITSLAEFDAAFANSLLNRPNKITELR